jgi:hypothetical protein
MGEIAIYELPLAAKNGMATSSTQPARLKKLYN